MVFDMCQVCGEEHEPPRSAKGKLVRFKKPTIKSVKLEAADVAVEIVSHHTWSERNIDVYYECL